MEYEVGQNFSRVWSKLNYLSNRVCCLSQAASGTNSNSWLLTGNSGTNIATNFIGTTDNQGLVLKTNNVTFGSIDTSQNILFTTPEPNGISYIHNGSISLFSQTLHGNGFDYYTPSTGIHALSFGGDYSSLGGDANEINVGIINESTGEEAVHSAHYNGGGIYQLGMEVITNTGTSKLLVQNNLINIETSVLNIGVSTPASGKVLTSDTTGNATWQYPTLSGPTTSEPSSPFLGQFYFDTTLVKMKFWNGTVWAIITSTP